jgi:hypothetical protein
MVPRRLEPDGAFHPVFTHDPPNPLTVPSFPRRSLPVSVAAATVAVALLVSGAGCSKKNGNNRAGAKGTTTAASTTTAAEPPIVFTVSGIDDSGTPPPDDATIAAVKQTLDDWVAAALVGPLKSGQPAGDLSAIFTTEALGTLANPATRATLVDEGMPAAKSVKPESAGLHLTSVAEPDGTLTFVAARIDLKLHVTGPGLDVSIVRDGEVVLAPEDGRWKIESFTVRAMRDSLNDPATTTTTAAP